MKAIAATASSIASGSATAFIWPPNSNLAIETIPTATIEEGPDILRARAYAAIDADIDG